MEENGKENVLSNFVKNILDENDHCFHLFVKPTFRKKHAISPPTLFEIFKKHIGIDSAGIVAITKLRYNNWKVSIDTMGEAPEVLEKLGRSQVIEDLVSISPWKTAPPQKNTIRVGFVNFPIAKKHDKEIMLSSIKDLAGVFGNIQHVSPLNVSPNSFDIWYLNEFPKELIGKTEIRFRGKFLCSIRKNNNFCQKCSAKGHTIFFCPFKNQDQEIPQDIKKAIEEEKTTFGRKNKFRKDKSRSRYTNPNTRSNTRGNETTQDQSNATYNNYSTSASNNPINTAKQVPTNMNKRNGSNQTTLEKFVKNVTSDTSSTPQNTKRYREKGNNSPGANSPPNKTQAVMDLTNDKPVKPVSTKLTTPTTGETPPPTMSYTSSSPATTATPPSTFATPPSTDITTATPSIHLTPSSSTESTSQKKSKATPSPSNKSNKDKATPPPSNKSNKDKAAYNQKKKTAKKPKKNEENTEEEQNSDEENNLPSTDPQNIDYEGRSVVRNRIIDYN